MLEEVVEKFIDYRGKTPQKTGHGVPLVTAKIIKEGFIQNVNEFIAEDDYDTWMRRGIPRKGDVVLTTEAPLGEVALIDTTEKIALAQRVITLRGKKDVLDSTFLKYSLQGPVMQARLRERESGSTVTGIRSAELKKVKIEYPCIKEQNKVGSLLKGLDDKIYLNKKVINNLDQLTRTLFKRWFLDFEFPNENGEPYKSSGGEMVESELGMIPKGWIISSIGDLSMQVSKGTTPSKKDFDSTTDKNDIEFLKVKDINDDGLINFNNVEKIPEVIHLGRLKRSVLEEKDILLSIAGTIGRLSYIDSIRNGININQAIAFIRLKDIEKHFLFIYSYLKTDEFQNDIKSKVVQGVQANVSLSVIKNSLLVMPSNEVLDLYNTVLSPIIEKIASVRNENEQLVLLRDTLLPKLLSGELELPNETEVTGNVPIP